MLLNINIYAVVNIISIDAAITILDFYIKKKSLLCVSAYNINKLVCICDRVVDSGLYANVILQLIVTCVWFIKTTLYTIFNVYHAPTNCMIHSSGCIVFIWTSSELFYSCATQHLTSLDIYHASFAWFIILALHICKITCFYAWHKHTLLERKKSKIVHLDNKDPLCIQTTQHNTLSQDIPTCDIPSKDELASIAERVPTSPTWMYNSTNSALSMSQQDYIDL